MLKEGFYYDDYSYDTTGDYTLTASGTPTPTATWNSSTNTLDIESDDNDRIYQVYTDANLPNSGYLKLKFHVSHSYPDDVSIEIRIREDTTNYYKAHIVGDSYALEYISKYVGGVETDAFSPKRTGSIVTVGGDNAEDVDVEIEFWWSPTYLKLMIDSDNEMELDCTTNTSELDIANLYIDWYQGDYEIEEMIVSYYTPKIGVDQLVNSKSFSEVGPVDGLINYWPMNGHLKDYGEGNNDGTVSGATVDHTAPRDKMCYDFTNSAADKIELIDIITCSGGEEWSWSFWGYKTSFVDHGWAGHQDYINSGRISFNSTTQSTVTTGVPANQAITTSAFPTNEWFNCIVTHSVGNIYTIYLNGSQAGQSTALTGDILVNRIGDNPNNSAWPSFNGLMFDFRIYNKVLSTKEINILSNMFDTDGSTVTNMSLANESWYVFGEIKEQL